MKELRVNVNQIELQVREYEREGEAIVFLHFGGANLMMWQRSIPYFQDRYRLILVDLRGHGKSDHPETDYHIDTMASDVVGVMQHIGLGRAHIIGSSMGAEVGLSVAANYPEKVISLACDGALSSEYGPYGTWEGSEADFEAYAAGELEKMRNAPENIYPSVDALVDRTRQSFEKYGWWNEYVEAMERYSAYKVDEGKYRESFGRKLLAIYLEHYFHYRFEEYYEKVKCPLLMLPGEEALKNEREKAAIHGLKALAARGQIVEVAGWVHPYGWLIDPDEMCKVVLKFLGDSTRTA